MTETLPETRSLIVERVMSHAPQKIWRALTQAPLLESWMMQNDFEPVVGRPFNFRAPPMPNWNGVIDCKVLEVEPHTRLAYSWTPAGDTRGWVVTWTLTPANGGTHVRMEQSGFGPGDDAAFQGATFGWRRFVGALEDVLGKTD
jgi:uncharacterized protein YndB with AHSA1/START domain